MINLENFLRSVEFKITGGSDFGWTCFGPNARYLDCDSHEKYSISAIFDSATQDIYVMEAWDYPNNRAYRWVNPEFAKVYINEYSNRELDFTVASDDMRYVDLEDVEDFYSKANSIYQGVEYDTRVSIPINMSDNELLSLFKIAHERDITFNQLVEEILTTAIQDKI